VIARRHTKAVTRLSARADRAPDTIWDAAARHDTAGAGSGTLYLTPLSFLWDGSRNLQATGIKGAPRIIDNTTAWECGSVVCI
jgi:hypothetical protein